MRRRVVSRAIIVVLAVSMTIATATVAIAAAGPSPSGMTTNRIADGLTATDLATSLVGGGVTLNNASYSGAPQAAGTFAGGGVVGFPSGVVLATGDVDDALGPNSSGSTSTGFGTPGDPDLAAITGQESLDAAVLALDVTPSSDTLSFQYVFASEEYEEFIDAGVNDAFAFFINGTNCATFQDGNGATQFVSIDTVNPSSNPALYRSNTTGSIDLEYDGLTVVMTCTATVTPGIPTTLKLAISDSGDDIYDSAVFLQAGSITSGAENTVTTYTGDASGQYSDPVTLSATVTEDDGTTPVAGATVNFQLGTQSTSAVTNAAGVASAPLVLDQPAQTTTVTATYAGSGTLGGSSDTDPFAILLEDCTLVSTTPTSAQPGTVTLSAQFGELDASVGNLGGRTIDFTATDLVPTATAASGLTNGAGVATANVSLTPGIYTVEAAFAGDGHYAACVATPTELTLASSAAKVTGGGRMVDGSGHITFGFVAEATTGGMIGQLQVNGHGESGHRFHGYEVTSLDVSGTTATWSGVGRLNGQDGYTFDATIEDNRNGKAGGQKGTTTADHVTMTIRDGSGNVVWTFSGPLDGGNVKVHE